MPVRSRRKRDWQSRELRVVGSLAYNHEDFHGAMRSLASGAVDVAPLTRELSDSATWPAC